MSDCSCIEAVSSAGVKGRRTVDGVRGLCDFVGDVCPRLSEADDLWDSDRVLSLCPPSGLISPAKKPADDNELSDPTGVDSLDD